MRATWTSQPDQGGVERPTGEEGSRKNSGQARQAKVKRNDERRQRAVQHYLSHSIVQGSEERKYREHIKVSESNKEMETLPELKRARVCSDFWDKLQCFNLGSPGFQRTMKTGLLSRGEAEPVLRRACLAVLGLVSMMSPLADL